MSVWSWYNWLYPKEYAVDYVYSNAKQLTFDYEILVRKTYSPVTMGFEVEQPPIMFRKRICSVKDCHRDGSGPAETSFGVYTYPMAGLKEFIDTVGNDTWVWVAQYVPGLGEYLSSYSRRVGTRYNGCGSHWHFRPNFKELYNRYGNIFASTEEFIRETWAVFWNSLMELVYILLPLQIWHYRPRDSAKIWAKFRYIRYNPNNESFLRLFDRECEPFIEPRDPIYLHDHDCCIHDCSKHESYEIMSVSWCYTDERDCGSKPITVEWRLPEVHPAMWATAAVIIINAVRFYYDRGYVSTKLRRIGDMRPKQAYREIYDRIIRHLEYWTDVFEEMGPVEFYPGRGPHPWRPEKIRWNNMRELFNDLLRIPMLNKGTPYYRVAALLKAGCSPYEQGQNDWWNILAPRGQFRWSNCRVDTE